MGEDALAPTPDTAMADTAMPEAAMADTAMADTAMPEAVMADTAILDTAMPMADTAVPESSSAVTAIPNTAIADTAMPDSAMATEDIAENETLVKTRAVGAGPSTLPMRSRERYEILSEIARGGMGRIISVRDLELGRKLAIKEQLRTSPALNHRFEREIHITTRLQHPAIITALDAGCWPSGELFFTMKHVDARPLDKVIAETKTLGQRLELLPHLIAVVEALAYAHDLQIIHRDLKPANVLVGAFGETVVIDWGLAKDLRLSDSTPDDSLDSEQTTADNQLTQLGEAMGTPAYMPPEQAKGRFVDQRADVYALGAMLYHLLTGDPPYQDSKPSSAQQVLDKVKSDAPTALSQLEGGVPPDLITIVNKAMSRKVDSRYANAMELAAELKRFSTGQLVAAHSYSAAALVLRWVRKHRAAVAVGLVMGVALLAGGIIGVRGIARERDRAQQERTEAQTQQAKAQKQRLLAEGERLRAEREQAQAETNRRAAEELMQLMLDDLSEKLAPIGRLDILDVIFEQAKSYYKEKAIDYKRPYEVADRALFLYSLGNNLLSKDKEEEALARFQEALEIQEKLVRIEPKEEWIKKLSDSHSMIASLLVETNKDVALKHYRLAIEAERGLGESALFFELKGDLQAALGNWDSTIENYKSSISKSESNLRKTPSPNSPPMLLSCTPKSRMCWGNKVTFRGRSHSSGKH